MTVKERLILFLKSQKIGQSSFEKKVGLSNGYVNNIRKSIQPDKLQKISLIYPQLNIGWLIAGEGEMMKTIEKEIHLSSDRKLIPFYDINAEAGTIQVSNMDVMSEPDEWIDAGDWFRDADSAMRVHGDSMFPLYKSGSIVVMKEVCDKSLIMYGQDYVLVTSEYRAIKRIQKSSISGCWLLCSVNDEVWEKGELAGKLIHEPFDVNIDNIYKIFRVLGCVNRNESSRIIHTKNSY